MWACVTPATTYSPVWHDQSSSTPTSKRSKSWSSARRARSAPTSSTADTSSRWGSPATSARRGGPSLRPRPATRPVTGAPTGPGSQSPVCGPSSTGAQALWSVAARPACSARGSPGAGSGSSSRRGTAPCRPHSAASTPCSAGSALRPPTCSPTTSGRSRPTTSAASRSATRSWWRPVASMACRSSPVSPTTPRPRLGQLTAPPGWWIGNS